MRLRSPFSYRREVDAWRSHGSTQSDHRRHCLDVLCVSFTFERQTTPDARWHFGIGQRHDRDGVGFSREYGWARRPGRRFCLLVHVQWYVSFSVRPFYRIRYAPTWIHSVARLTGSHPIRVAEQYVAQGRELTSPESDGAA